MANYVSKELPRGMPHVASYTPFIVPDITHPPWAAPTSEHSDALSRWLSGRQPAKTLTPHLPWDTWVLYRVGFISASGIVGSLGIFGSLVPQSNHFEIALRI